MAVYHHSDDGTPTGRRLFTVIRAYSIAHWVLRSVWDVASSSDWDARGRTASPRPPLPRPFSPYVQ